MGLFTSTSTGRGCISIGAPLRSVIRERGSRSTVPSISRVFHVKMIHPAVGSPTTLPSFIAR